MITWASTRGRGRWGGGKRSVTYDPGIPSCLQSRVTFAVKKHQLSEAGVDARGEEGGPDGQADDLHEEAELLPGVVGRQDPGDVA